MFKSSRTISVDPDQSGDAYYRYQMPPVQIKIEGGGNGIKTVVPNIHDICDVIKRPEEVLLKFLGVSLGTISTYAKADDKFYVMGEQTQERMQQLLYRFIIQYVLCRSCRNPETVITPHKKKIQLVCKACSGKTDLDATDKIVRFLSQFAQQQEQEAAKKLPKKKAGKEPASAPPPPSDVAAPQKVDDLPPPAAAVATEAANGDTIVAELADLLKSDPAPEGAKALVVNLQAQHGLAEGKVVRLVFRGIVRPAEDLFPPTAADNKRSSSGSADCPRFIDALHSHLTLLKSFVKSESAQKVLLHELQRFCNTYAAPSKFMMACKLLVEEGVLEDTQIVEWSKGKRKEDVPEPFYKHVKQSAAPFVEWLCPPTSH